MLVGLTDVDQEKRARYAEEQSRERVRCQNSLRVFVEKGWRFINPQAFVPGWHLDAIAEHLQAVTYGDIKRLIINVPPRMTKSSLVSVAWPAWTWTQNTAKVDSPLAGPGVQFLTSSYAQSLSLRDSVRSRRLIQSSWYQGLWGHRYTLTGDQNAKHRYENNFGGYRLATSTGGALTGEGGDVIVVDDPHNTMDIESEVVRESVRMWWDEAMSTRLNNISTGAYVIIMQRLYGDDLTGHILDTSENDDWVHLMLPMEFEPERKCYTILGWEDPREEDGELLCEARVPATELPRLKRRLGEFGTAGQLQQRPSPRGGGILKSDWWVAWPPHVEELFSPIGQKLSPIAFPVMDFVLASVDTASTEKEENDFSAMTVWGLWRDKYDMPMLMLMDSWKDRLTLRSLVLKILALCEKRKVDRLLIEAKNNGFAAAQEVARLSREGNFATVLEPVKGDKVARAHACSPTFEAGQVWAPARNQEGNIVFLSYAASVIDECAQFPKGAHDDIADTVTQAINHFRRTGMLQSRDDRITTLHRERRPPGEKVALYGVRQ